MPLNITREGSMIELIKTKEACEFLKMSRITLMRLVKENKIPAFKFGRLWKFDKTALEKLIQEKLDFQNSN